jgi:hypothetical protein
LEIKGWTRSCGAGVFSAFNIFRGAVVCSHLGEVITDWDVRMREALESHHKHTIDMDSFYKCWTHLKVRGRHSLVDAHSCGDTGRLLKHVIRHTSHFTRHTSHLTPHTSHLTPHTSHLTPHTSHVTRHTSHLKPHTSHVTGF